MHRLMTAAGMLLLFAAVAAARGGQAGQTQPSTGKQEPAATATRDLPFAKEAAVGGIAEVELGQLAAKNAEHADVKQFGERMVTDHGKANDELKQIAQAQNITLPAELDARHKATRDRLAKLTGAAFDKAYMAEMLRDHQQDVTKFRAESRTGRNPELKAFAGKTLPTLQEHLKMARETNTKVGGKKPSGL